MKKCYFIIIIIISSQSYLVAQIKTIEGTALGTDTKKPLAGAAIYILKTEIGTVTDTKGYYKITVPDTFVRKKFLLVCHYPGYDTDTIKIIQRQLPLKYNFSLIPSTIELRY